MLRLGGFDRAGFSPTEAIMKTVLNNINLKYFLPFLFISISILLIGLSTISVNCPLCSSVAKHSSGESLASLKIQNIQAELVDYTTEHRWCFHIILRWRYKVGMTLVNESSESLSVPLVIVGTIPQSKELVYGKEMSLGNAKYLPTEVLGNESKRITELIEIFAFSRPGVYDVPNTEFSVISDPEKIIAECPICEGKGAIPFTEWLMVVAQ